MREWLLERGIAFAHAQRYADAPSICGVAESNLNWVAMAHLVGLGDSMIDLAVPAINAIDRAIANRETIGFVDSASYYGLLLEAKAMAQWMVTGRNAAETWSQAFDERLATNKCYEGTPMRARDRNSYLDNSLAVGLQAGRYAEAIAFCDQLLGGALKVKAQTAKAPRQLAYLLCQRALGQSKATDAELVEAGHRVLREHLTESWLHFGQHLRAAMWLKIVYELEAPQLSPAEVMLKAYDDMPTVPRPDFLPAV